MSVIEVQSIQRQFGRVQGDMSTVQHVHVESMQMTDWGAQHFAKRFTFVVASFPFGAEPLIHGFAFRQGQDGADAAWNWAHLHGAPADAVLCRRTDDDFPTWIAADGRKVTLNDCKPQRKGILT